MKKLEFAATLILALAQKGHFSDSLNQKIIDGDYELRPSDLVVKAFINGAGSAFNLLEGEQKKVAGVNDLDGGYRLNQNRAFFGSRIRIDIGNAGDAATSPSAAVFGGVNMPEVNEAKLMLSTSENELVYDRTVSSVNQGVSTDDRKSTEAYQEIDKPVILVDDSNQKFVLHFAPGVSTAVQAAGINRAIAVRLDGFEIIGK
jgi:hypothetical protein